jgi:hypothetical protein
MGVRKEMTHLKNEYEKETATKEENEIHNDADYYNDLQPKIKLEKYAQN